MTVDRALMLLFYFFGFIAFLFYDIDWLVNR